MEVILAQARLNTFTVSPLIENTFSFVFCTYVVLAHSWHNAVNTDAVTRTKHFLSLVFGFVHILTPVQTCCCLVLVLGHMLMLALHVWTIFKGWLISVHKLSNFEEYFVLISKCFESPWSLVGWFLSREWSLGTPWTAPNVKLSC